MGCFESKQKSESSKPLLSDSSESTYQGQGGAQRSAGAASDRERNVPPESQSHSHARADASRPPDTGSGKAAAAPSTPLKAIATGAALATTTPAMPIKPPSSSPSVQAPETSLARPVVLDTKALAAVVERAEEDFLDVQRSALDVEAEDPNDPNAIEFIRTLRSVEVSIEGFSAKLGALPRPPVATAEAVMSALAADPLPKDVYARAHAGTAKIAQAFDSVGLRDTKTPIVVSL